MSCRCGAVQCYLCRAKDINYSHFCQHFRNPKLTGCSQCKKTCLLWHPEDYVDSIALNELRKEAEEEGVELCLKKFRLSEAIIRRCYRCSSLL
ncbi:unnamed protein product [Meloidogyne enterolobii]|uniref:Uncharacterized protein n=1 Tax=Meloidogyne enterolobii TaxID=390850 RepID=A0ACB0XM69_MELEN